MAPQDRAFLGPVDFLLDYPEDYYCLPPVEGGISTVVEPLAVVGDVKESVYTSSSLLSSSPAMCSGEDGLVSLEWVSCSDRTA